MSLECEHGQLARACNICEYEREIAELRARVGELEAALKRETNEYIEAAHGLVIERDRLKAERDEFKARLSGSYDIEVSLGNEIKALKAELAESRSRVAKQQYTDLQLLGERDEKIRRLENELAEKTADVDSLWRERDELKEVLRKALPRMAHRFECVSILPSEMWHQNGSVSLDSCACEIKVVKAALAE